MANQSQRVRAVDVLRGIAMLGVIAIHARPTVAWIWHEPLVDRAVPVFLVLLGVSAELWRQKHADGAGMELAKAYLAATGRRLLLPFWTWLACVTAVALVAGQAPQRAVLWLLAPLGYVPWAGPTWFITAIALLSLLIPVFHLIGSRVGPLPLAAAGLVATVWSHQHALAIIDVSHAFLPLSPGKEPFFLFWIFVPSYFWHVTAGLWLGRARARVSAALFSVCALALIWGHFWLARPGLDPFTANALAAALDVPLTIALLGGAQYVARLGAVASGLAYLGRLSWGLYLGHVLVFVSCEYFGRDYQWQDLRTRILYFLALVGAGLVLTAVGRGLRALLGRRLPIVAPRQG